MEMLILTISLVTVVVIVLNIQLLRKEKYRLMKWIDVSWVVANAILVGVLYIISILKK